MHHLHLCESQLFALLSSSPVEIPRTRRRYHIYGMGGARHMFYESLGSSVIQVRTEWWDPTNSTWNELTPWTTGSSGNANTLILSESPQFVEELHPAVDNDILVRAVAKGNGLLSPVISAVVLEIRP